MWIISYRLWLSLLLSAHCFGSRSNLTVVDDIWNAFRAVTNDSALLDHIIPEMYGKQMRNANPTFIFKMPTAQRHGYQLVRMHRSDFGEPVFPNITKRDKMPPETSTQLYVKSSPTAAPADEWKELGLEGWAGELNDPLPWVEDNHKDVPNEEHNQQHATYPRDQILLDLKGQQINGNVKDISILESNHSKVQRKGLMSPKHVYIARANNPFGYSMKWAFNNESNVLVSPEPNDRGKRDVAKLYSMIKCSTGCDPLIYKGYGCYCGFGGHGVPVDGIDRCCRIHDKCYGQSNCISYLEYFVPYVWKCYRGKPLCAVDHGQWGGPDSCAARLCQCDLRLSRCLRQFYCPNRRSICHSSRSRRLQNLIFFSDS